MIVNRSSLLAAAPIKDMLDTKVQGTPTSYGLTECGYDIRLKQEVIFEPGFGGQPAMSWACDFDTGIGTLVLGSSVEEFDMPANLMGRVLNKSTWARLGLDASMTTNIEPGWKGFLTIELVYHGNKRLHIPAGSGICQIIFERIEEAAVYSGKYQNQGDEPVKAMMHPDLLRSDKMSDNTKAMLDYLYLPPADKDAFSKVLWDSFDDSQKRRIIRETEAKGVDLPEWMKLHQQRPFEEALKHPDSEAYSVYSTGTHCSECGADQFTSPGGITCPNGHGGAEPAKPLDLPKQGPIQITGDKPIDPSVLDLAVEQQKAYYGKGVRSIVTYAKGFGPADGDAYIIDGFIKNAVIINDICHGQMYGDAKNRFADGADIHTSRILEREGNIIRTRNSVYEIEEFKPEPKEGKPICSEDGCYRTEDCGPACRNRN